MLNSENREYHYPKKFFSIYILEDRQDYIILDDVYIPEVKETLDNKELLFNDYFLLIDNLVKEGKIDKVFPNVLNCTII